MRRRFSRKQRIALYLAAGGRCQGCGRLLVGWHFEADHIVPFAKGGRTEITNGRALCARCNRTKGDKMPASLRRWQEQAIAEYFGSRKRDFLLVATPAAGKTRVAAEVAHQAKVGGRIDFVVIVVPTFALREQTARDFARSGLHIDPKWRAGDSIPADVDGIVVTYAAVEPGALVLYRIACAERRTLVILDEIHHCGEGDHLAWGNAIKAAFADAAWRLALSGTPFRSDNYRIPFITYEDGMAVPDFVYGYGAAMGEDVCRFLFFPKIGGLMEWSFGEEIESARLEEAKGDRHALRTAIMPTGGWIEHVLGDAHRLLVDVRTTDADAAGLIIADGVEHAGQIASRLRQIAGLPEGDVVVVTHEQEDAAERIRRFREARTPWIVAVQMVSEGVDIPRLRVGVWATARKTLLLFRQGMGRVVRHEGGDDHMAWFYIPADADLLQWAGEIAQERTHVLREQEAQLLFDGEGGERREGPAFTPISSEGVRDGAFAAGETELAEAELRQAERIKARNPATATMPTEALALFARGLRADGPAMADEPAEDEQQAQYKRREDLRTAATKAARAVAMRWGLPFNIVGARLNRTVGIVNISAATIDQLERYLKLASHWRDTGDDDGIAF